MTSQRRLTAVHIDVFDQKRADFKFASDGLLSESVHVNHSDIVVIHVFMHTYRDSR